MSKTKKDRRDVEKNRDRDYDKKKSKPIEEPQELDEFGIPYL